MRSLIDHCTRTAVLLCAALSAPAPALAQHGEPPVADQPPPLPEVFLRTHCLECHSGEEASLAVRIDSLLDGSLTSPVRRTHILQRIFRAIKRKQMPPADVVQPADEERRTAVRQLDAHLLIASQPRALMRRLTGEEYQNTVRSVLGYQFVLPQGFPADSVESQFRNTSAEMVMSAPLMEAYYQTAAEIADRVFPPQPPAVRPRTTRVGPTDLVISYSSGLVLDETLRLAARTDTMWRSSTWPERFEARRAGTFAFRISASAFAPGSKAIPDFKGPMKMQLRARSLNTADGEAVTRQRLLAEFEVSESSPQVFQCMADLYENETPVIYFSNAVLSGDRNQKKSFAELLTSMFTNDPRLLAGWLLVQHGNGLRGGVGWDRVRKIRDSPDLDLSSVDMSEKAVAALVKKMTGNPGLYAETVIYQLFEEGPALAVHSLEIEGPTKSVISPAQKQRQVQVAKVIGERGKRSEVEFADSVFAKLLPGLFRRPVTADERASYLQVVTNESSAAADPSKGMHLALRSALMSPHFLYRESDETLDEYALAARLSYFLTLSPPDIQLRSAAAHGQLLSGTEQLRKQAARILSSGGSRAFVDDFMSQWLQTHDLIDITPDPQQFPFFNEEFGNSIQTETQLLMLEVIRKNLPLRTLIEPGFTFADGPLAKHIYQQEPATKKGFQRIDFPDDSPHGGLLSLPAVMLATSNGTDTQPVLRGVWVLNNILGDPPPEPPSAVPALTPDTRGASTVRELLAAHRTDPSCAACHRRIDPAGMAFENLDPLGRWRTQYPSEQGEKQSQIDASGRFPRLDQPPVEIVDIRDLKKHVLQDLPAFGNCFSRKLLNYAMGRPLSWGERREVDAIVRSSLASEQGVRDLILDLVSSQTFRTR